MKVGAIFNVRGNVTRGGDLRRFVCTHTVGNVLEGVVCNINGRARWSGRPVGFAVSECEIIGQASDRVVAQNAAALERAA